MERQWNEMDSVVELRRLDAPRELRRRLPASEAALRIVRDSRNAIRDLIHGRDRKRLLVVVGPCSIHDPAAAVEYATRLRAVADATRDELVVVMRTYLEKPRTSVGWKGLVNDPALDGSCDVAAGLEIGRRTLGAINDAGVACGSEILDPSLSRYFADLVSWAAIGARTSQSQPHREMASGLAMPVGFKNGVDGDLDGALNGIIAASRPHTFAGVGMDGLPVVLRTKGNRDAHLVLRGGTRGSNFAPADVAEAARRLDTLGGGRRILVDCSHDNSRKDPRRQAEVFRAVLEQIRGRNQTILGLTLESHLEEGRQSWRPGCEHRYGVSITDACIGWEETKQLLEEAAAVVATAEA
jgi:3-deoxy-7-phosphoheptulonate synthase